MTANLLLLPDLPAFVVVGKPCDRDCLAAQVRDLLDNSPVPLFYINDLRSAHLAIDDLLDDVNTFDRTIMSHPRIRENILVSQSDMDTSAAQRWDSLGFASVRVRVLPEMNAVVAYVRDQVTFDQASYR